MTPGHGSIVIYKYLVDLFIRSASGSEGLEIPGHLSQVSTWCTYLVYMTWFWNLIKCMETFLSLFI